jgi:adenine deaminase
MKTTGRESTTEEKRRENYLTKKQINQTIKNSVNLGKVIRENLSLPQGSKYRVIQLIDDQIITKKTSVEFDTDRVSNQDLVHEDLVKLAVVERHNATGNVGLGLLKGLGLEKGAIATSIGHDSHNIITVGLDEQDMLTAIEEINELQGGIVITHNNEIMAKLRLPIAGLMSDQPLTQVADKLKDLRKAAETLGVTISEPFMTLSFMALPVIPRLKVTDRGLFSAEEFEIVPLVIE